MQAALRMPLLNKAVQITILLNRRAAPLISGAAFLWRSMFAAETHRKGQSGPVVYFTQ